MVTEGVEMKRTGRRRGEIMSAPGNLFSYFDLSTLLR